LVRMNVKSAGPARRLLNVIFDGPHELVLSEFLLEETARVLRYPRLQDIYRLTNHDIAEHIELLRARSDLVNPVVLLPIVLTDPNDDPVLYTAVTGQAGVLCTMDRDFYTPHVISFCQENGIEVMNDVELLEKLR